MNSILIIIPTFNESKSIINILDTININVNNVDVLIVDDNSPDNTSLIVKEYIKKNNISNIHLICRKKKLGLGSAYIAGFKYALEMNYKKVIQMDADLSHDPKDVPVLISASSENDLVIGSRYLNGIRIINWPISRLLLSYFANLYARKIIGLNIFDITAGFKCINTSFLKKINLDKIKSEGYSFQIEIHYLASVNNCKICEVPIIFTDRTTGDSKMSLSIILEAIFIVPYLKFKKILKI